MQNDRMVYAKKWQSECNGAGPLASHVSSLRSCWTPGHKVCLCGCACARARVGLVPHDGLQWCERGPIPHHCDRVLYISARFWSASANGREWKVTGEAECIGGAGEACQGGKNNGRPEHFCSKISSGNFFIFVNRQLPL